MVAADRSAQRSNDPLVVGVAKRWRDRLPSSLRWGEFLQEGEVALAIARRDFDPARGIKFETYATGWVRGHLSGIYQDAIRETQAVSLPAEMADRTDLAVEAIADLIWDEVDRLPAFAREAVIRRFGLDGYGVQTQRSTASSMGCDPRRIHRVVEKSLRSMRERLAGDVA